MLKHDKESARRWIEGWKNAAMALEEDRIRSTETHDARRFIRMTSGLISALAPKSPRSITSGLVEQQKYFQLTRR